MNAALFRHAAKGRTWLVALRRYLVFAGVAHLLWEFAHLPLYTIWLTGTTGELVFAAVHCTGGDILITLSTLVLALLLFGASDWPQAHAGRVFAAALLFAPAAFAQGSPAPEGASVYIVNLKDGDTVTSPVTVVFGLRGMGVAPAGTEKENTGHHHLLIDTVLEGAALRESIPADDNHRHFGAGQTEVTLELAPGTHTLQMVLGDHFHVPHEPPVVSAPITITVK